VFWVSRLTYRRPVAAFRTDVLLLGFIFRIQVPWLGLTASPPRFSVAPEQY